MSTHRRILLADADAFFVAVARFVDPEGAGREPLLIVGGTRESRGVVCSASYETRQYVVRSGTEAEFMNGITLAEIPLIGPRFQERLARLGMRTVPDVLQYDEVTLAQWLGKREAAWLCDRVRGIDGAHVESNLDAKSISRDETFSLDIDDDAELQR